MRVVKAPTRIKRHCNRRMSCPLAPSRLKSAHSRRVLPPFTESLAGSAAPLTRSAAFTMIRGMSTAAFILSLLLTACLSGFAQQPATGCDAHLWQFVYHPQRLPTKTDCRTVTGSIRNFVAEGDGDYHIRFIPDDKTLVNATNKQQQKGALVVEPICQNTPTQPDAIQPCQGYDGPKFGMKTFCPGAANTPPAPPQGHEGKTYTCKNPPHLQITGFYTIDNDHGWMELHTVSNIQPADNTSAPTAAPTVRNR